MLSNWTCVKICCLLFFGTKFNLSVKIQKSLGKQEISIYQHFLLFLQNFQMHSPLRVLKLRSSSIWIRVNPFPNKTCFFYVSVVHVFWKHYGKRKNCLQQAISPFPSVFSSFEWTSASFIKFEIFVCNISEFGRV